MMRNQILHGDCLERLRELPANSVDAVITDPPYALGFMGKAWDSFTGDAKKFPNGSVEGKLGGHPYQDWCCQWLTEALRVLKPGGTLFAFGGTRTFHRLACAIEDAGFEYRDTLCWLYGCLSDDSEVITKDGFKPLYKLTTCDIILAYDIETDSYQWEVPERWYLYKVQQDTAYRISSDRTEQLVSRGHRCIVERDGKFVFKKAEELASMERVPTLRGNIHPLPARDKPILLKAMQRLLSRKGLGETRAQGKGSVDRSQHYLIQSKDERREQSRLERRRYISQAKGFIRQSINQVCALSQRVYQYGAKGWLCYAASPDGSTSNRTSANADGVRSPYQPQRRGQSVREPNPIRQQSGTQTIRIRAGCETTLATVTPVSYSGYFFCPTVSTGAFVARRKGKIFITGNSGFPKAQDLGAMYDADACRKELAAQLGRPPTREEFKAAWKEFRLVVGEGISGETRNVLNAALHPESFGGVYTITAPRTDLAREWGGWKVGGIKPAYEPIAWARKPCEGSTMANVLKYGGGAFNADAGRVATNDTWAKNTSATAPIGKPVECCDEAEWGLREIEKFSNPAGRFPPNLLLDENLIPVYTLRDNLGIIIRTLIEEYYGNYNLPRMWKRVSNLSEQTQERTGIALQPSVLLQGDEGNEVADGRQASYRRKHSKDDEEPHTEEGQGQPRLQGALPDEQGILLHQSRGIIYEGTTVSRENDTQEPQSYSYPPPENGSLSGETAKEKRSSASPKRRKERQPNTELGDTITSGTLQDVPQAICRVEGVALRERRLEVLACDIPSRWLKYFEPTGYSLSDPTSAAAMLDEQSGEREGCKPHYVRASGQAIENSQQKGWGTITNPDTMAGYNDTGGASRFFPRFSYTPKSCAWERNAGLPNGERSGHPTVKPIRLMRWLIELVTREGDTILDPLCGSGSTGCACVWSGRNFIGIEKEAEYHAIAEARVAWWTNQRGKEYDAIKAQWDADNGDYPLFEDNQ